MTFPPDLAVDFGTSSTVAVIRYGDGRVLPLLMDGSPLLPSAVFVDQSGSILTGRDAVFSAQTAPSRFEPNPKRRIDDGTVLLGDSEVPAVDLIAAVLERVRREYVLVAGGPPRRTVLTHPAAWRSIRLLALRDAAERAGLGTIDIVVEPVAAATYFTEELGHRVPEGAAVLVFDFGGGTFDTSVVRRGATGFEVLSVDGLNDLGGLDIDDQIVKALRERHTGDGWAELFDMDDMSSRRHRRTFLDDVRELKERLSRAASAPIYIPRVNIDSHVTREELEQLARPMLDRAAQLTTAVLRVSGVEPSALAGVFGVGGGSRMPLVGTIVHTALGVAPTLIGQPELVVAQGALLASPSVGATPSPPTMSHPLVSPPVPLVPQSGPPLVSAEAAAPPTAPTLPIVPAVAFPPPGPATAAARSRRVLALIAAVVVLVVAGVGTIMAIDFFRDRPADAKDDDTGADEADFELAEDVAGRFGGHSDDVNTIETIEHDGRLLALSAGWDQVLVWDVETHEVITSYLGQQGDMEATIAVVDEVPLVVSFADGSGEEGVAVWDLMTGEERWRFEIDSDRDDNIIVAANSVDTGVHDDSPVVAAVLHLSDEDDEDWIDREVATWDLSTGETVSWGGISSYGWISLAPVGDDVMAVVPDDDGDETDPQTVMWDLGEGRESYRVSLEGEGRYGLVAAELDRVPVTLATMPNEGVLVRRLDDGGLLWTYEGHGESFVTSFAACTWDGRAVVVSGDEDGEVHAWSIGEDVVATESVEDDDGSGVTALGCVSYDDRLVLLVGVGSDIQVMELWPE
ncbi:Hsp70 family protein [Stackebrandtia soli]|uniref:Hsp70 family protein n=1 Tax=Stackebrandtia soli TaxID=1892856 RepID=UPI0039E9512B